MSVIPLKRLTKCSTGCIATLILRPPPLAIAIEVFGHEIDTGVGADPTFLCLQIEPCDGEYYVPVGDLEGSEKRMFYGAGQDSYWPVRNLIPFEAARQAVRYFIEHQERIPSLRWTNRT